MIDFKPIALADKNDIDTCLVGNSFGACDFCFTNFFAWRAKFNTNFAIIDKTLFIRETESNRQFFYMMPVGEMPLKEALLLIVDDAKENNIPLIMKGITEEMWINIQQVMPNVFEWKHDRDNDEYIYLTDKLITLQGKYLQPKRNHINRFKAEYPNWEYFKITTEEELHECSAMLDKWDDLNISKAKESLRYDYIATKTMLEHFHYLKLTGGALRANGEIVAFSIGEPLTEDTFVTHVEKAFGGINGAYSLINQQFAEHEFKAFKYVNREEDMGLEYLRKAKMSYHPDILLREGILTIKS